MGDMMDPETLDLMIRLQLEDAETLMKGKHRIGKAPDGEFAMQLFKKELESLSAFNTDRIMSRSIAQAVRHDANEIQNTVNNEEQATCDRQYAVCLNANRPYMPRENKTQRQRRDNIDEEMLAKLASMYMDDDCQPESSSNANGSGSGNTKREKEAKPTRRCVSCLDDFSCMDTAQCPCGDHYCRDCMANLFEMAIGDESLFPVRCCKRPIPLALGQIFLPAELVGRYRAKKLEYETPNRTYCHEMSCATFVPPQFIVGNNATCVRCSVKTCTLCKGPLHENSDCPRDTITADVLQLAKSLGWKRCFSCRTMIELNTGCNHITCRCGAQFCYECGEKWKTCSCAQWQERRLYDRANAIVDRDGNQQLNHTERAVRVEHERQNLVANHELSVTASNINANDGITALNKSLHGAIHQVEPFALPCFSSFNNHPHTRDETLCKERQTRYLDPLYRREFPGGYMYDTSSINASDPSSQDQCLLDLNNPSNPAAWTGKDCKQGNLPSHYLTVRSSCDAAKAFKYAAKYNIKLSIKNSGHTYLEDASGADSLLLWTRKLQRLRHDPRFVPTGCDTTTSDTSNAITMGAGISCGEAYEFADAKDVTILCGYSPTVGLSGGWVQNGGHSVMSNVYGLGVDRVLQYKVVTPDGQLRIANKCQNTDLFWALRGGGGGTFGLVLESTHKVEPKMSVAVALIEIPTNNTLIARFMDLLVDTAVHLAKDGWGGHIYGNKIIYVSPIIKQTWRAKLSMARITTFALAHGGTSKISMSPTWYKFFQDYVLSSTYSVGNLQYIGTQLAPTNMFTDHAKKRALKQFFHDEIAKGNIPYIPVDSPYLALKHHSANETSANPAWYDSLWEIGIGGRFTWNSTLQERLDVVEELQKGTNSLEKLTGGAAYKNEANPFTNDWKEAWYGGHYDALLKIKNKYDPRRLLRCWGCVGWTKEDAEESSYRAFTNITGY